MIQTSKEYKEKIKENRTFFCYADIILADGTQLSVDNHDIMSGGWGYEDSVSSDSSFCVGAAIINKFSLTLQNTDRKLDQYNFTGAQIKPSIGLKLSSNKEEILKKGIYTVDDPGTFSTTVKLTALDNMSKFEVPYRDVGTVYPANLGKIVLDICLHCGVQLATKEFDFWDYEVQSEPEGMDGDLTCLSVIAYAAQISGNYARCNQNGELELKWYDTSAFLSAGGLDGGEFDEYNHEQYQTGDHADGGNFDDYSSGYQYDAGEFDTMSQYHHLYVLSSLKASTDDIIITGVKVADMDGAESGYGNAGYRISISENPLILSGKAPAVAEHLGQKLTGMRFRPLSASILSDPSIEAGDPAYVSDQKGNSYPCYLTGLSFSIGKSESIKCAAETPSYKNAAQQSPYSQVIIDSKRAAAQEVFHYNSAVSQVSSIISAGYGLNRIEVPQEDGTSLYYMCNGPTIEESTRIWQLTSAGLIVSKDGATTWAIDEDGQAFFEEVKANRISAEWINVNDLSALHATIAGWQITEKAIYKDVTASDGTIYRVYFQPPQASNPEDTWVLSIQKSTDNGNSFNGVYILYSDGSMKVGEKFSIDSEGVCRLIDCVLRFVDNDGEVIGTIQRDLSSAYAGLKITGSNISVQADRGLDLYGGNGVSLNGYYGVTGEVEINGKEYGFVNGLFMGEVFG